MVLCYGFFGGSLPPCNLASAKVGGVTDTPPQQFEHDRGKPSRLLSHTALAHNVLISVQGRPFTRRALSNENGQPVWATRSNHQKANLT